MTVMCDMFFFARLIVDQSHTRAAERCSAPGSTCEVRMPERVACQSAPAQAARLAWARRPRLRRRSLLPSPTSADPPQLGLVRCAWRRDHRGNGAPWPLRLHPGKLRRCGRAVGAIPCSRHCPRPRCPRLRELPILPRTGAAMLCSWPSRRRSHRGRRGQEWRVSDDSYKACPGAKLIGSGTGGSSESQCPRCPRCASPAQRPRAVPFGGSGHSPPEEQPARRKRRNSLVVVQSVTTLKYNQCVSCEHS